MQALKNLGLSFVVFSVFCQSVSSEEAQRNEGMISALDTDKSQIALMCDVGCSQHEERTGYARLHWVGPIEKESDIRLDFTVYEGGFEADAYATFLLSKEERKPQLARALRGHNIRAFEVRLTQALKPENSEEMSLAIVEKLEPSLNYQWRLLNKVGGDWIASQTVICAAPICIAD